jgi:hypothetical protein
MPSIGKSALMGFDFSLTVVNDISPGTCERTEMDKGRDPFSCGKDQWISGNLRERRHHPISRRETPKYKMHSPWQGYREFRKRFVHSFYPPCLYREYNEADNSLARSTKRKNNVFGPILLLRPQTWPDEP